MIIVRHIAIINSISSMLYYSMFRLSHVSIFKGIYWVNRPVVDEGFFFSFVIFCFCLTTFFSPNDCLNKTIDRVRKDEFQINDADWNCIPLFMFCAALSCIRVAAGGKFFEKTIGTQKWPDGNLKLNKIELAEK